VWATIGTILAVSVALIDVAGNRETVGGLVHTGPQGPAAALMRSDLPDEPQFRNGEHDGPMVYAIARAPMHLDVVAESLDRPRYRLQHPLLSWLGWIGHPTGGGDGLVRSLFVVGMLALLGGGLAMGALATTLGGPSWLAVVFPVLPGSIMSLRITVADALAMALALGAIVLSLRGRPWLAAALACLAVLSKEPTWLTFVGVALWRRDREAVPLVVLPAVVAGGWALWLRHTVPSDANEVIEFVAPFKGWIGSLDLWAGGNASLAIIAVVIALGLTVAALVKRRPTHPLYWAVVLNLAFFTILDRDVIGLDRNGTRMTLPLLVLAVVALATPLAAKILRSSQRRDEVVAPARA
jgi:hypothetical protein